MAGITIYLIGIQPYLHTKCSSKIMVKCISSEYRDYIELPKIENVIYSLNSSGFNEVRKIGTVVLKIQKI